MVITLTASTFGIIAGQVAASAAGQWFSNHTANQIKDLRERARLDALQREQIRDDTRFLNTFQAQLEIEELSHQENLIDIETSFKNALIKIAHKEALSNYPLLISPYLIRKSILTFNSVEVEGNNKQPQLFCILSNSNNTLFNQEIFSLLDYKVGAYINMYWNAKTTHTICYYDGIWNNSVSFDDGHTKNLQALMPNAPIIMVTPYLEPEGDGYHLYIKVNYWGTHEILIDPQGLDIFTLEPSISSDKKETIVEMIVPWIVCSIAFYSDVFYWFVNKDYPILPLLLNKGLFNNEHILSFFKEGYLGFANKCIISHTEPKSESKVIENSEDDILLDNLVALNTYHFPMQNIAFLRSVCYLSQDDSETDKLLYGTAVSLYEERTGLIIRSLSEVNPQMMGFEDMVMITELAHLSKQYHCHSLYESLMRIIRQRIVQWN